MILHGGALGDLILTLQTVLRIADVRESGVAYVISRIDHRPLTGANVRLEWRSPDALRTHWLFRDGDAPPPAELAGLIAARCVLNFLDAPASDVHRRLLQLDPAFVASVDPRPIAGASRHITDQWLDVLGRQGLRFQPLYSPALRIQSDDLPRASPWPPDSARCVLIHPGGGGASKQWPVEQFKELGRALAARGDCVQFALGPVEQERFSHWRRMLADVAPVADCTTLTSLADWLRPVACFIGNDSGPGHVAAALGVPTITLFGPTRASVWRPQSAVECAIQGDGEVPGWRIEASAVISSMYAQRNAAREA